MLLRLLIVAAVLAASPLANAIEVSVDIDTFNAPLAEHGEWVMTGHYGRVWRPHHAAADWRPYYDGQWVWTDEGYFWVSDEPWAWATYHYGRWAFEPAWGWIWVPGYEWAPAWVDWRYGDGSVGWAPMFPTVGISLHRDVNYAHWTFVPTRSFVGVHVTSVAYRSNQNREHWAHTKIAPSYHHAAAASGQGAVHAAYGPPRVVVERQVGHPLVEVKPIAVSSHSEARRHRGSAVVFRPGAAATPPHVTSPTPSRAQPTRAEPARPEPVRVHPTKAEPARPEPVRVHPTKAEPARPEPVRVQPTRAEPARPEPVRVQPTRAEPARPEPVRAHPTRAGPARPEPVRAQPTRAEPARIEPGHRGSPPAPARPEEKKKEKERKKKGLHSRERD